MFEVAFLRTNSIINDPRVARETHSLAENGFNVLILAWDRKSGKLADEFDNKITTKRFRLRAPVDSPLFILFIPFFWFWAFIHLAFFNPQVVHACDFDTMPVGIMTRMLRPKTKLVYDSFEYYPGMIHAFLNPQLESLVRFIDKAFTKFADCLIIPCEERRSLYKGANKVIIVPNTMKLVNISNRSKAKEFTLFYGGGLKKERGVSHMIKAVMHLKRIHLVLAGDGPMRYVIDKVSKNIRNITYLGILSHQDTLEKMVRCHATVVFYEPTNINSIYAASSKLFEAMMLGVPIIANEESIVSKIVVRHKCGLVVPYGDSQSLTDAILQLKNDPALRRRLEDNGKIAFKKQYSWDLIELDFVSEYRNFIQR